MSLSFCGKRILLTRTTLRNTIRQNGYIVLVPEIGEDLPEKNPLRHHDGLPEFTNLTIENCMASIAKQTLDFEAGIKTIETQIATKADIQPFRDIFEPLEHLGMPLDLTWGLSKTLYLGNSSLMPTKSYIAIHDRAKRARAAKFNNPTIYSAVKRLKTGRNDEETRILAKYALEGRLNGLDLASDKKTVLSEHLSRLATERFEFRRKLDQSSKQFSHPITDARDFDDSFNEKVHKITLAPHIYSAAMESCSNRELRWNLWQANIARGSGYGNKELATSSHLESIRFARRDIANLLNFENYAQMSMETKMAADVDVIMKTIEGLLDYAKSSQDVELHSLLDFAQERGFRAERIELWDLPYWRRKQQKSLYNYDENKFRDYFPLSKVLDGLFRLAERLFEVSIRPRNKVGTWHKDVKFYDVFESHSSAPVGGFYLDPYASDEKVRPAKGSGWMVGIQNASRVTETRPLAALIFNFEQPHADGGCFLTFGEVRSVFRRFGQVLQHLLTRTNYSDVAGSSNIEWDAVEVAGNVMNCWLGNAKVVESVSEHRASGDSLPSALFRELIEAERHLAGVDLCKELYLSALDLELHSSKDYWLDLVKKLWPSFRAFPLDKYDSHPCNFAPIFVEEWAAAYYSHFWARMVAADVYSAFEEVGNDEKAMGEVGRRFRDTFLALGGSLHAGQVFRRFRGRDPSPKALLFSLGLKKNN